MIYRQLFTALFIITTFIVLFGTLSPSDVIAKAPLINLDKVMHFLAIGGWTASFYLFTRSRDYFFSQKPWMSVLLGITFGMIIELLQYLLPINRSAEFGDIIANATGALFFGYLTYRLYNKFLNERVTASQ